MSSQLNLVHKIINEMRVAKGLPQFASFHESQDLRNDFGFDSFDLAELTVRIEDETGIDIFSDGIVSSLGQVYLKFNAR